MKKAVVRELDGLVVNVIVIEEGANWQPPTDCYLIDAGDGSPGDTWDGVNFVKPEPPELIPPLCTHWAIVDSFYSGEIKPMRVRRTSGGKVYTVDCYVTEGIKQQYLAGDIVVGDLVLVEFLEGDADKAIVVHEVFKTW